MARPGPTRNQKVALGAIRHSSRRLRPVTRSSLPIVALLFWGATASARTPPSTDEARAQFGVILQATTELATAAGSGRNVRGALQAWDRRWRVRLRSLGRVVLPAGSSCEAREIAALVGGTATAVWGARMFVFSDPIASLGPLARELAARRLLADEAARRGGRGATCADLGALAAFEERAGPADASVPALLERARH